MSAEFYAAIQAHLDHPQYWRKCYSLEGAQKWARVLAFQYHHIPVTIEMANGEATVTELTCTANDLQAIAADDNGGFLGGLLSLVHDTVKFGQGEGDAHINDAIKAIPKRQPKDKDEEPEDEDNQNGEPTPGAEATESDIEQPSEAEPANQPTDEERLKQAMVKPSGNSQSNPATSKPAPLFDATTIPHSLRPTPPKPEEVQHPGALHHPGLRHEETRVGPHSSTDPSPTSAPIETAPKGKDKPGKRRKSTEEDIPSSDGVAKVASKDITVKGKRHGKPGEAHIKAGDHYKLFHDGSEYSIYRRGDGHFVIDPSDVGKLK